VASGATCLKQSKGALQVAAHPKVEVGLTLRTDSGRKMKDQANGWPDDALGQNLLKIAFEELNLWVG
jgi:hypothetical protein